MNTEPGFSAVTVNSIRAHKMLESRPLSRKIAAALIWKSVIGPF